jgi:hypothetical protein
VVLIYCSRFIWCLCGAIVSWNALRLGGILLRDKCNYFILYSSNNDNRREVTNRPKRSSPTLRRHSWDARMTQMMINQRTCNYNITSCRYWIETTHYKLLPIISYLLCLLSWYSVFQNRLVILSVCSVVSFLICKSWAGLYYVWKQE